ncbi:MAG: lipid A ethanolaminephosphotransferase, partial [Oceanospirillaceae bacterium]
MFNALLKEFANQSSLSVTKSGLNLYFSVFIALFYNQTLWRLITDLYSPNTLYNVIFLFSFLVLLTGCINIIVSFFSLPRLHKPALITILLSTALVSYFMESYGVLIDQTMIQNAVETNTGEVFELININLILHFILSGIIPALIICFVRVRYQSLKKSLGYSSVTIVLTAFVIVIAIGSFYKDYSMTFRDNREIRYLATPTNYLYYSVRYLSGAYEENNVEFTSIGQDAQLKSSWQKRSKKVVSVIIVGETARAANFSLNGYHRNTNPKLAAQNIINFSQASSCGTTTAVSVA